MALPELHTIEDLFDSPRRTSASISPDGTRIAFLAPWRNRLNIWVQDLEAGSEPRAVTADETRSVQSFEWADDPRRLLYLQDDGGDQRWHLYRVDLGTPGSEAVDLTPFPGTTVLGFAPSPVHPGKVILLLDTRDLATFDSHELDIATGELGLSGSTRPACHRCCWSTAAPGPATPGVTSSRSS